MTGGKNDITQTILQKLASLNENNISLKNALLQYAGTTANTMTKTAAAIETINKLSESFHHLTNAFKGIQKSIENLDKNISPKQTYSDDIARETQKYNAAAEAFDKVMKVSAFTNALLQKNKYNAVEEKAITPDENFDASKYSNIAFMFNRIMKVSSISKTLIKILDVMMKSESFRRSESQESKTKNLFKSEESNSAYNISTSDYSKSNKTEGIWGSIENFITKIPLVGDIFKIAKGLTLMIIAGAPVLAILSHVLSTEIKPWQGTIDLLAKLKVLGGTTFEELSNIFITKMKDFIQWPFKFLKEKIPSIFSNIKIPFAKAAEEVTIAAGKGARGLGKTGFFSKFLGKFGSLFVLKRLPVIGTLLSFYFAYDRYKKGDYTGMLLELGSGIAAMIPGAGTAISLGLGGLLAVRDMLLTKKDQEEFKVNKDKGFLQYLLDGIKNTMNKLGDFLKNKLGFMGEWVKSVYEKITSYFDEIKMPKMPILNVPPASYSSMMVPRPENAATSGSGPEAKSGVKNISPKTKSVSNNDAVTAPVPVSPSSTSLPAPITPTSGINSKIQNRPQQITVEGLGTEEQIALLEDTVDESKEQTMILRDILRSLNTPRDLSTTPNMPQIASSDVRLRQQISDTRRSYLETSSITTNLLRGSVA
jgi:hypothetical protein